MVYFRAIFLNFELTLDKDKERISMEEKETETYTVNLKIDIQGKVNHLEVQLEHFEFNFEQKSGRYCSEKLFPSVPVVFPTVRRRNTFLTIYVSIASNILTVLVTNIAHII